MERYFFLVLLFVAVVAKAQLDDVREAPDGVSIQIAEDGSYQIISVGTGTYDFDDPDDIKDARRDAEMRAKAAIAKFFKEDIATEEGMSEASQKVKQISSDGENQTTNVSKTSVKETMESIRNSASALLTGVVILQSAKIPGRGSSGEYRVMVGVSSKTVQVVSAAASDISTSLENRGVNSLPSADAGMSVAPSAEGTGMGNSGGGSAALPPGWVVCIGVGSDRREAVTQALIEGISQVYGQMLQNDERMSERMTKMKANANILGKKFDAVAKVSEKQSESNTLTKTAGFVKEYRVIQVVPMDGNQEATVYAHIVNPRAGGTVVLRVSAPVMTTSIQTKEYQLGPKRRMNGAEVAKALLAALPNGLLQANQFLLVNDASISNLAENQAITEGMVAAGLANGSEIMQLSQGLTPDFSIRTEVTELTYSKKLGLNKATKKMEPQYKMRMVLNLSLTNDRTGQLVKTEAVNLTLDSDEIRMLLEEDEEADLLQAIFMKLSAVIAEWIAK